MKHIHTLGAFSLGLFVAAGTLHAETLRLADGTQLEGELAQPGEVIVKTAAGEKRVAFHLLPPDVQRRYWVAPQTKAAAAAVALIDAESAAATVASVTDEELAALANEVNLETWEQVAAIGSFRDKAEKRGPGGLVVTKAFNALEENWVSVYSPKDPVGEAGNWDAQLTRARLMQAKAGQFIQRRWLELFIKAGDAVARRDSNEFAAAVREMKRSPLADTTKAGAVHEIARAVVPGK